MGRRAAVHPLRMRREIGAQQQLFFTSSAIACQNILTWVGRPLVPAVVSRHGWPASRPATRLAACLSSLRPLVLRYRLRLDREVWEMPEVSCLADSARLQAVDVLLVEDDPGDVLMTREVFE